ncbi:nitrosoguanidine resistance protein SNG1 [Penicillium canescens]|uniref:Nitrosoguanidine resistance protein SNG1 n=1 Tax=Penicillium canescens TaxID=5083 RepID=A0AAD6I141_PENCN|nr:nitrosoguanidine resistance protein SNG1 [Penicillium canescens]KAJ6026881.1 nitrosoguanidine resistance protein SNG1 [Penicillium canescens]KAJ6040164.1 nitrosoguanidine resistance protein SNG1 [Penicillium canescens]KAJ6067482.1 nitrosoguanidine resistance protein SNG1 [Penicillium canescens]KAJ6085356.1 nitrosoguanidine resistance protein SNG1 [Penicillium canescens]KAJ6162136.1 nitrosoguanidine resistance protein SNG1 [Penicillium canescens]
MAFLSHRSSSADAWKTARSGFLTALTASCISLQVLLLANLAYLYGTQFEEPGRVHNLNLLYVDYDGGVIGQSVLDAYHLIEANTFPTIQQSTVDQFPTTADVRSTVCKGDYWGAIYSLPNASDSLATAIVDGSSTPATIEYVWNEGRYAAFMQSAVYANFMTLIKVTRSTYYANNASKMGPMLSDPSAMQIFLNPIEATEINIKPTIQGTRVLYNTVSMIMPIIMQFFFMMALNGISAQFNLFTTMSWHVNGVIRMGASIIYTFLSSLCTIGYIWGFKEAWDQNGNQFVLSWMAMWLFMHINLLLFDILTTFVPMQFMPFCVLTWMIVNVASTISPFELSPGFYHWGYALPAHETYKILGQIWSDGCNNELHRALPILFSWWIVGIVLVVYAVYYRCKDACALQSTPTVDDDYSFPVEEPKTSVES